MKKNMIIQLASLSLIFSLICTGCVSIGSKAPKAIEEDREVKAYMSNLPFEMPEIKAPQFPNKDFNIIDYGAKSDGVTLNTEAFAEAIDACNKAGGGRVVIPSGTWLTGPIELKSNVNLYSESGALVIFSANHDDYKITNNSVQNPIYGSDLTNIAITGNGVFNGNGDTWRPVKKEKVTDSQWNSLISSGGIVSDNGTMWWPTKDAMDGESTPDKNNGKDMKKLKERPILLYLTNCKTICLDGPTFENSARFATSIRNAENLIIRNTKVFNEYYAQNGDGLDITGSKNVLMYNDTVNAGDDGICMKSSGGSNTDTNEPAMQNVVIQNCIVNHAHGGFVVGSNTDGGMKNIYVHNCDYVGTDAGIKFKSDIDAGGLVEDIFIDGIGMKNIVTDAISFDTDYSGNGKKATGNKIPQFQNIHISNVTCDGANRAVNISGLDKMPVKNLDLKNINIKAKTGFFASNTSNINMDNVRIIPEQGSIFNLKNSDGYVFNSVICPDNTDTFLSLEGERTTNIQLTNTDTSNAKQAVKLGDDVKSDAIKIG